MESPVDSALPSLIFFSVLCKKWMLYELGEELIRQSALAPINNTLINMYSFSG